MISNSTLTTIIELFFGVSAFILIMLLPALLELKKPKDAGPRIIMDDMPIAQNGAKKTILLASIEEEPIKSDQTIIKKIADIIAFLPNLET